MMQHQPRPYQNNHANPQAGQRQRQHSSPRSSLHHTEAPDSDDGGQSGDDGENEYDDSHESTRQGKRKRPISVSYVHVPYLSVPPLHVCHIPGVPMLAALALHVYQCCSVKSEERRWPCFDPLTGGPGLAVNAFVCLSRLGHHRPCSPYLCLCQPHPGLRPQPMRHPTLLPRLVGRWVIPKTRALLIMPLAGASCVSRGK